MIAADNEVMNDVLQTLYECNVDENIRDQCFAREERLKKERYFKEIEVQNKAFQAILDDKDTTIAVQDNTIIELTAEVARLKALLEEAGFDHLSK